MDYSSDNEEAIVLSHDMEAEAELLIKYMKEQRKARLQMPASQLPKREKC